MKTSDIVRIMETRPLSATKRRPLQEVVEQRLSSNRFQGETEMIQMKLFESRSTRVHAETDHQVLAILNLRTSVYCGTVKQATLVVRLKSVTLLLLLPYQIRCSSPWFIHQISDETQQLSSVTTNSSHLWPSCTWPGRWLHEARHLPRRL